MLLLKKEFNKNYIYIVCNYIYIEIFLPGNIFFLFKMHLCVYFSDHSSVLRNKRGAEEG